MQGDAKLRKPAIEQIENSQSIGNWSCVMKAMELSEPVPRTHLTAAGHRQP